MRKLAWLTLFAAAALLFGAPENAFAHQNHHHASQTQTQTQSAAAPSASVQGAGIAAQSTQHQQEFVSAASPETEKCPHGQGADCNFCCACAGSASVAIATPDFIHHRMLVRSGDYSFVPAYRLRPTVLDLTRPPKFFA